MSLAHINLIIHIATTTMMLGIIWFVQIVHYPLFRFVGEQNFQKYAAMHTQLTGLVVAPLMILELLTGILLLWLHPNFFTSTLVWIGLVLLAIIWGSTAFIQVPLHRKLSQGFNPAAQHRLVRTNWIRTVMWSFRGILLFWLVLEQYGIRII